MELFAFFPDSHDVSGGEREKYSHYDYDIYDRFNSDESTMNLCWEWGLRVTWGSRGRKEEKSTNQCRFFNRKRENPRRNNTLWRMRIKMKQVANRTHKKMRNFETISDEIFIFPPADHRREESVEVKIFCDKMIHFFTPHCARVKYEKDEVTFWTQ